MNQQKEYYAFISYKREDEKWAKWLQHELEHYKFPTNLNGRTDLPPKIYPTCRDVTDLSPGPLEQAINNALCNSEWLIVVCSPRSAKSPWVCKEAQAYIDLGRADHIIPFVIEGSPFSNDKTTECYPEALLNLTGSKELLAANIKENGREHAAVKVVARMFNLKFDSLWQRYNRDRKRKRIVRFIFASLFAILTGILTFSTIKYFDKSVIELCKTGIKADDGLFQVQQKLLKYQKYAWLLKKETRSLLRRTIYGLDYSYNISPFPIIYSHQSKGGLIDQLRFRHDEAQIVIGTGIYETSGVLDYKKGKFKHFQHYAASVDYINSSDTIISCGMGVYKYDKRAKPIAKYEIDGYGMLVSSSNNLFSCKKMNELTIYDMEDGDIIANKDFGKDILCYAYNKSGEYLAVATIDSLLSYMCVETGEIVWQRKFCSPIGAITAAQDDSSFFVAFYGDSTRVSRIELDSLVDETLKFTVPLHSHQFHKDVLSYTTGDYLAFTNGRYFVLHNIRTGESFPMDVKNTFNSEMDAVAMSPSGTKVCYAINGKVYVAEIKEKTRRQCFPIQYYGFKNVIGPTIAGICSNDSLIVMAVIKDRNMTSVGLFNLYSGDTVGPSFKTSAPIWKVLPMPTPNHAAVAIEESNSWLIVDFSTAKAVRELAVDTLVCTSNLMLTANRKFLIGLYTGPANYRYHDSRCVWSATTYDCVDSVYFCSGPLQDGEHMYNDYSISAYPGGKELYTSTDLLFIEDGEIFDGDEMAYVETSSLLLFNLKERKKRSINLRDYGQGDSRNYKLNGFKNGFALLFNKEHLMIIDTENEDLILQKATTPYECITSATFFNNQPRVLVTTDKALYIFDLFDYEQLIDVWEKRLTGTRQ